MRISHPEGRSALLFGVVVGLLLVLAVMLIIGVTM
jgi:hypothetical protein